MSAGNTGAVLVIAPSLDFQFVTFSPAQRSLSAEAKEVAEQKESEIQQICRLAELCVDQSAARYSLPPAHMPPAALFS